VTSGVTFEMRGCPPRATDNETFTLCSQIPQTGHRKDRMAIPPPS
jgi:hypothetical protein